MGQGTPEELAEEPNRWILKTIIGRYSSDDCSSFGEIHEPLQ